MRKKISEKKIRILMEQLILEKLLRSEFNFGFELECCMKDGNEKGGPNIYDAFDEAMAEFGGSFEYDATIMPDSPSDSATEYASGIITFSPMKVKRMAEILYRLSEKGIYTNSSCGFHVHFSWGYQTLEELIWSILQIGSDDEVLDLTVNYKSGEGWGKKDFEKTGKISRTFKTPAGGHASLDDLIRGVNLTLDLLTHSKFKQAGKVFFEKVSKGEYALMIPHGYGTLEWRGPRQTMDFDFKEQKNVLGNLKGFVSLVYKKINLLMGMLLRDEISHKGEIVTKDHVKEMTYFIKVKDKFTTSPQGKRVGDAIKKRVSAQQEAGSLVDLKRVLKLAKGWQNNKNKLEQLENFLLVNRQSILEDAKRRGIPPISEDDIFQAIETGNVDKVLLSLVIYFLTM